MFLLFTKYKESLLINRTQNEGCKNNNVTHKRGAYKIGFLTLNYLSYLTKGLFLSNLDFVRGVYYNLYFFWVYSRQTKEE